MTDKDNKKLLNDAILTGRIDSIMALVHDGAPVNGRHAYGRTLMHVMALNDELRHINLLAERGADARAVDDELWTPLHLAATTPMARVTGRLVELGCDLNAKTVFGNTALHHAVKNTKGAAASLLMALGADVNIENDIQLTALDMALKNAKKNARPQTILELVAHGANVQGRSEFVGRTKISRMIPWQAAILASLQGQLLKILNGMPAEDKDIFKFFSTMATFAKKAERHQMSAIIQSHMADRAVMAMLGGRSCAVV